MSWMEDRLWQIRLSARHTGEPLRMYQLAWHMEDGLSEQQIKEAYAAGLADRAARVKCMCTDCMHNPDRIVERERLRQTYYWRRRGELVASGMALKEVERRIDAEIATGAALRGTTHQEAGR